MKYLTALTSSFAQDGGSSATGTKREPSIKRKRLHLLYLLNDVLYHSKYRSNDASICAKVQPVCMSLFAGAAAFKNCPKHQKKIEGLLDLWEQKRYYSREYIDKLRESVKNATEGEDIDENVKPAETIQGSIIKHAKATPYVMPATHGDSSTPWFDLPAGNLMPHIVPNSTRPINPDMIKPLKFVAGPADEGLVLAVKALLEDVDMIYGRESEREEKGIMDIDDLGQPIILDEITGEVLEGEGYYGWSRSFCEKMKRRKKGGPLENNESQHRRSRSRSSSPDIRKRRYSDSDGSGPRRRRRSYSSSRSPTPDRGRRNGHSGTRSRSHSRSRPGSSPHRPEYSRNHPPPPPQMPPSGLPPRPPIPNIPPAPFQHGFNPNFPPPPPPPPPQMMQNMPFNPQGQQHWPPQPPPAMPNMQFNHQNPQMPWPPPPPPGNPPGHFQQQPGQYPPTGPGGWQGGRGYQNNGWNGNFRGGRGGYRGRGW